jgi:hypothetical protein
MPGTRSPNLTLLPELAAGLRQSVVEHGLDLAILVALLVRNDVLAPAALVAQPPAKLSRVAVSCSMRAPTLRLAARGAKRCGLSRNAYLEALIAAHLAEAGPLMVLRSKGSVRL